MLQGYDSIEKHKRELYASPLGQAAYRYMKIRSQVV